MSNIRSYNTNIGKIFTVDDQGNAVLSKPTAGSYLNGETVYVANGVGLVETPAQARKRSFHQKFLQRIKQTGSKLKALIEGENGLWYVQNEFGETAEVYQFTSGFVEDSFIKNTGPLITDYIVDFKLFNEDYSKARILTIRAKEDLWDSDYLSTLLDTYYIGAGTWSNFNTFSYSPSFQPIAIESLPEKTVGANIMVGSTKDDNAIYRNLLSRIETGNYITVDEVDNGVFGSIIPAFVPENNPGEYFRIEYSRRTPTTTITLNPTDFSRLASITGAYTATFDEYRVMERRKGDGRDFGLSIAQKNVQRRSATIEAVSIHNGHYRTLFSTENSASDDIRIYVENFTGSFNRYVGVYSLEYRGENSILVGALDEENFINTTFLSLNGSSDNFLRRHNINTEIMISHGYNASLVKKEYYVEGEPYLDYFLNTPSKNTLIPGFHNNLDLRSVDSYSFELSEGGTLVYIDTVASPTSFSFNIYALPDTEIKEVITIEAPNIRLSNYSSISYWDEEL